MILNWPAPCDTLGHHKDTFQVLYGILGANFVPLVLDVPFSYECEKLGGETPADAGTDADLPYGSAKDAAASNLHADGSANDAAVSDALADGPDNIGERVDGSGCNMASEGTSSSLPVFVMIAATAASRRRGSPAPRKILMRIFKIGWENRSMSELRRRQATGLSPIRQKARIMFFSDSNRAAAFSRAVCEGDSGAEMTMLGGGRSRR
jgi:hypothetical protein